MKPLANETRTLQDTLSRVLTWCTVLAGVVGVAGVAMMLANRGGGSVSLKEFAPAAEGLRHPASIMRAAFRGEALAVMQCAVIVLIATPVLRVATAAVLFLVERDWLYVAMSALVLVGLALGLVGWVE